MKVNKKKFLSIILMLALFFCLTNVICLLDAPYALAGSLWDMQEGKSELAGSFGQSASNPSDPRTIAASVIKIFLSFLGIIFVILMVLAGYRWMTAGGNEDEVSKAKSQITAAIIGFMIIMAAYAITLLVFGDFRKEVFDTVF